MTHTPGPWHLIKLASNMDTRLGAYGIAYGEVSNRLAIVDGEGNSSRVNEENARLIAAAPALLEALEDLTAICALTASNHNLALDRARAAIALAKGEAK